MNKEFSPEVDYQAEQFKSGFNLKTVFAALFIGFIMLPGSIYLGLITGAGIGGAAQWVTLILFVEIAKRSFVKLSRQETYIIYILAGSLITWGMVGLHGGAFNALIWNQYLVQSTYAKAFGLDKLMPSWVVPPAGSEALIKRTFLDRDWLIPIILLVVHSILFLLNRFGLGYVLFRITSDVEKLEFPMAPVAAEGATALAETSAKKETWRWKVFSIAAMIGVVFGSIYIVIPTITGLIATKPLMLIPIPWVDFTAAIGAFLPTVMLGFFTDLTFLFAGFVLPFWVVAGIFIGAIGGKVILSPILYRHTNIFHTWQSGMSVIPANIANTMDFWLSITIGTGVVVGLIGIWKLITARRNKKEKTERRQKLPAGRGDLPIWLALLVWFVSTSIYIIICHILVPNFPLFLFVLFGFILTPFLSYISARMFGITGVATGVSFPMVREGTFILSGYKGADIWFAPVPYFDHGGATQEFKQLELTKTRFTSWYKAEFMALAVMLFCSFLFWSIIWRMGPIPSSTYPYVQKLWPMSATFQCLWATSTVEGGAAWMLEALKFKYIVGGSITGIALYALLLLTHAPVAIFYGIVGGIAIFPHQAIPMFLGALLGRFYFAKKLGKENWRRYTPILLAGYACGMGLIGMFSIAVALIAKTVFQLVF